MARLFPKSLLGQVMASAMLALLLAQIVAAALLFRAVEERRESATINAIAFQLVAGAELRQWAAPDFDAPMPGIRRLRRAAENAAPARPRLPRRLRYLTQTESPLENTDRHAGPDETGRLQELLATEGIKPHAIVLLDRRAGDDPALRAFAQDRPRLAERQNWRERRLYVGAIQRTEGGPWEVARVFEAQRPRGALGVLILQTLVTFVVLGTLLFLVLRRITRPLAALTERVGDFSAAPGRAMLMEETGPADTRRLIAAHNAMEARIAAMLDEKDVMLGAIGHDLKTPLAALRVRIESVPDESQRAALAATIEDITQTLDDILSLARIGRARRDDQGREAVDIRALADSVVEEFEDLGEPVALEIPSEDKARLVASVQETWLKRALRNLVSNAVRYGGDALVSVRHGADQGSIILQVDDKGPGIPDELIADMLEPFKRGEASRNRSTGGAGLGLTLARAIADAHDGKLVLSNRPEGGLRAQLHLPT